LEFGLRRGADQAGRQSAARRKELAYYPESAPDFFVEIHVTRKVELKNPETAWSPAKTKLRCNIKTQISIQGIARSQMSKIVVPHSFTQKALQESLQAGCFEKRSTMCKTPTLLNYDLRIENFSLKDLNRGVRVLSGAFRVLSLDSISSSVILTPIFLLGMSMSITSPSLTAPIAPPL
jgi:hypothetical protein